MLDHLVMCDIISFDSDLKLKGKSIYISSISTLNLQLKKIFARKSQVKSIY